MAAGVTEADLPALRLLRTQALFSGDQQAVRRLDSKIAWIEAGCPDVLPKAERKTPRRRGRR